MASVSRQIGWSQESNLLYQILKQITRLTSVVFGLKPKYKVFTALLTQRGGGSFDLAIDVSLVTGVTYEIIDNDDSTADFVNVGAPNNTPGTFFVATGTTPNSWGNNSLGQLRYDSGAPVAIVLENTIGNIFFTYQSVGVYVVNSSNLFIEDKTSIDIDASNYDNIGGLAIFANETIFSEDSFRITTTLGGSPADELLMKNRIEIRVYS